MVAVVSRGASCSPSTTSAVSIRLVEARKRIAAGRSACRLPATFRTIGGFLNNGTHGVDFHRYLLGDPARMGDGSWAAQNRYERSVLVEGSILSSIRFENGYTLTIEVDMDESPRPIGGSSEPRAMIRFGQGARSSSRAASGAACRGVRPGPLDELIAWIEGGPESRNAGHVALVAHGIMMASYEVGAHALASACHSMPEWNARPSHHA